LGSGGGSIRYILSFLKNDAIKCTESIWPFYTDKDSI
jgi:hypothetical protein